MRKKLFRSLVLFSMLISLLLSILLIGGMYMYFNNQMQSQLRTEADALSSMLREQDDPAAFLSAGFFVNRVTLIDKDGVVWFDSEADPAQMENHADRPEIIEAMRSGTGSSSRSSATIGETSVYYAVKLNDTYVLRVAGTLKSVWVTVSGMTLWIALGFVISTILAYQLAKPITASLIGPAEQNQPGRSPAVRRIRGVLPDAQAHGRAEPAHRRADARAEAAPDRVDHHAAGPARRASSCWAKGTASWSSTPRRGRF